MVSSVPASQAVFVTEWTDLFVVVIAGDFENRSELDLLDMALESGRLAGKHVVVDVSRVECMNAEVLGALLRHRSGTGRLPWLVGPLSFSTKRRLEVTGTLTRFRVLPTLLEATAQSRNE
ncbi:MULTISPECIES: STAS domain-containing protein [Streptomyces]